MSHGAAPCTRVRWTPRLAVRAPLLLLAAVLVSGIAAPGRARMEMMVELPDPPRFDSRIGGAIVRLEAGPPPISGGTLAILPDGRRAVVSDPDRDRILVVDLDAPDAAPRVESLPRGSEPGRIALEGSSRAHVILRGRGELASLDLAPEAHGVARRAVCAMPRGVAYQAQAGSGLLHVACRGGELVSLPAAGGPALRTLRIERDLRDVVVLGEELHLTRFRSAEVLVLDRSGALIRRGAPPVPPAPEGVTESFSNRVAWRALATPDGKLAMIHQRELDDDVRPSPGGYGAPDSFGCVGIVRTALSFVDVAEGARSFEIPQAALPVDFAIEAPSADGAPGRLALVAAGNQSGERSVIVLSPAEGASSGCVTGAATSAFVPEPIENPIAIAFASAQRIVVQQRDPARLHVLFADASGPHARVIDLGGAAAFDTGHSIFHVSTSAGIACASCHPEGGDDGHTWSFSGMGQRRTPALHAAAGTAPFHWTGDMSDINHLMREVFSQRMTGLGVSPGQAEAVEAWLAHVPAPRHGRAADAEAVARGRVLFEGEARCATCHSGPTFTNGASADVGTGGSFQVPTLLGMSDRLPLMHTGCAATLAQRFDPACGGADHGPALTDAQRADLVAYLELL